MFKFNSLKFNNWLILPLFFLVSISFAQSSTSLQVPNIDADFFQGKVPKNASYASMTYLDYRYDFAIEKSNRTGLVKVKLKVFVEANSQKSFLDRSKLNGISLAELVEHEQGHINLGYYIAYQVERALNAAAYTSNYRVEIRQNYLKAYAHYERLQLDYDEETKHGADRSAQIRWNQKIAKLSSLL